MTFLQMLAQCFLLHNFQAKGTAVNKTIGYAVSTISRFFSTSFFDQTQWYLMMKEYKNYVETVLDGIMLPIIQRWKIGNIIMLLICDVRDLHVRISPVMSYCRNGCSSSAGP